MAARVGVGISTSELHSLARNKLDKPGSVQEAEKVQGGDVALFDADLQNQYLEAIHTNSTAKRRYDEVAARSPLSVQCPADEHADYHLLDQRLELLLERKRHAALVEVQEKLQSLQRSRRHQHKAEGSTFAEVPAQNSRSENEFAADGDSINRALKALEMAVIQAHQNSKKERDLLQQARSSVARTDFPSTQHQLAAVSAVRNELTAWVEQGLAECQETDNPHGLSSNHGLETEIVDWDAKIDIQYERYLTARKRLIDSAASLRNPLPASEPYAMSNAGNLEPQPIVPMPPSGAGEMLTLLGNRVLPGVQLRNVVQAYLATTHEQVQKETDTMVNMIGRLSDESQLLSAFPMLSQSGRFKQVEYAFGKHRSEDSVGTEDVISKSLRPWLFAAAAATVVSADILTKSLATGNDAMDTIERSLAELRLLKQSSS